MRRRIRKVKVNPTNFRGVSSNITRKVKPHSDTSIVITPELYESNENYSNSLPKAKKIALFNALDNYAKSRYMELTRTGKPIVNMVFHGHWGWVFAKMVERYRFYNPEFSIVSSVNPIPGCSVYQYWRPASKEMQRMIEQYPKGHPFFKKGIHMVHDSPYDQARANPRMRINTMRLYHSVLCTSLEQKKFYENGFNGKTQFHYIPLGVGDEFVKKNTVNDKLGTKIRLGFVGRLYWDKVKGEESLMDLAQMLKPDKFEFVILSPNADEYCKRLRQMGYTVHDNKSSTFHRLYKMIDVTLILSKHEGTPLPLLESVKLGTYVLSNPVGEAPIVLPKENIIKSISDLRKRLLGIWNNRSVLKEFYDFSDTLIEDRTWERFTRETAKIWKEI